MPALEGVFFDFLLAETVTQWKQPQGLCTTLVTSWLKKKFRGAAFWKDGDPLSAPKKQMGAFRGRHAAYDESGDSAVEAAAKRFQQSDYEVLRNVKTGGSELVRGEDLGQRIQSQIKQFAPAGVLIVVTGTAGPHAMAAFSEEPREPFGFFDPNLGEVKVLQWREWYEQFFQEWKKDATYRKFVQGRCMATTFSPKASGAPIDA